MGANEYCSIDFRNLLHGIPKVGDAAFRIDSVDI
jgi:hypothetical protein